MRKLFLVVFLLLLLTAAKAQTDTAFWFAVPEASSGHGDNPIALRITSQSSAATIKVYVPANSSITPITVSIAANSVSTIDLSAWKESLENKPANSVLNNGLKIEASALVTAYFEEASTNNPEIYSLKGKSAVGSLFYVPGQKTMDNGVYTPTPYNSFDIVATEDNTVITIVPKKDVVGHSAGIAYTVTLNKGQTYSAWATTGTASGHLGGSKISSTKPIAVTFKDDSVILGGCRDLGGDQIVPVEMLGQEYIAINGYLTTGTDIASIMAVQDGTTVTIDGTQTITLNEGENYEKTFSNNPIIIKSNKPISVLHITGRGCEVGYAMLPQIGCNGSYSVGVTRPGTGTFSLFILCEEGSQGGFALNGNSALIKASDFKNLTGSWRYAQITLTTAELASGASALVTNSSGKFHLGIVYGNATDGVSYGYFSNFSSANSTISYNSPVCTGGTINFTCDPATTSTGLIYEWTGPNGFTSSVQNPSISNATTANSGTYYCKVTNQGCFVTLLSVQVTVNAYPTAAIVSNTPICVNNTLQLTGSSNLSGVTYSWSGPDNFTATGNTVSMANATTAKSGTYTLTVTNNGCSTNTTSAVVVNSLPDATVTGTLAVCDKGNLSLSSVNATSTAYAWVGPNSFTSNAGSISISNYQTANAGTYTLTASKNGCTSSSSVTSTIKSLPVAQITGTNTVCENAAISLTATDAGVGATYAWSGPSSFTSNTSSANINTAALTSAGVYSLTTTLNGCSNTTTQAVTVKPLPVAQINGTNNVCENAAISLTATDAGVGATYAWSGPSSFTSLTANANISSAALTNSGTYNLTATLNGCTNTATQTVTVKPLPVAQINGTNTVCENASINLTATDAGIGATYAWSGPSSYTSNTSSAGISSAALANSGTYTLTSTLNGCSNTATQTVTVKPLPVAQINGINSVCENAAISLTATDAGVGATYAWSGPSSFTSSTANANISSAALTNGGVYSLTTTLNGCANTATQTVTVKPLPIAQINGTNTVCENASINLTATDAGIGATYAWSGPSSFTSSTANANISSAALMNSGTYNLTATLNGCANTATQTVTVKPLPVAQITGTNTVCENAAISLTATDAGVGATYAWSGPSSFTSNTANANISSAALTNSGTYNLTATLNGCSNTATQTVTVKPLPVAQINGTNSVCENAAISLTAANAGVGAMYVWSGPSSFTSNTTTVNISAASFTSAGTYTITTTLNGCSNTTTHTVAVKPLPVAQIIGTNTVCENATVSLTATDAGVGATYAWSGPSSFTSSTASANISSVALTNGGAYNLTATLNGCANTATQNITVKPLPVAQINGTNTVCENASISLTATDAGIGATYAWSGPSSFTSAAANANISSAALANGGTYSLTSTLNGCTNTTTQTVTVKPLPVAQINGANAVCENASISLTATDAGAGATYAWSGPSSFTSAAANANISSAALANGGTYSLTSTLNGCTNTTTQTVTVKPLPVAQINGANAVCENAAISLTATDAGAGATYVWIGPSSFTSSTANASISSAVLTNGGIYTLTSTLNGCTNTTTQTVTVKPLPVVQINGANSVCENAAISLTATDAGVGATYAWSGPSSFTSLTANANISSAALTNSGTYNLTATLNGCANTATQTVTVKPLPVAQINGINSVCENAAISLTATDAGVGATYAWSGPSSFTSSTASANISSVALTNGGAYNLTATLNGCANTATQTVTVKPLPVAQINGINSVCENAAISLTATDAGVGATYAWSGPSSFTSSTASANISSVALTNGGAYNLTATLNGCANTATQNITVKPLPVAQINGTNTVCENASISLTATDAGIGATYAWSGPSTFTSNTSSANISSAALTNGGVYNLTTTLNGCSNTAIQTVTVKPLPVAQINGTNNVCENAVISLTATDAGVGATYAWNGPLLFTSNTSIANITSAALVNGGTYTLTSMSNGCTNTVTQTVIVKPLPVAQITGTNSVCENAAISLTAADAGVGATYVWSGPSSFTSSTASANISSAALTNSGTYNLTATLNGCTNTATQTVTVKPLPVAQINGTNTVCENASINLTATDAGVGATYAWSGPSSYTSNTANANITSAALNNSGTYNLTATLNGCSNTTTQTVIVKPLPVAQINGTNSVCENAAISLTAADAGVGATYTWSGPSSFTSNTANANISSAALTNGGTYTLIATLNGCTNTTTQTVTVKPLPVAQINGTNSICENAAINLTATDAGVGATYAWSGPSSFTSLNANANISSAALTNSGTYNLTATLNGCTNTATQTVTVKPLPVAQINGANSVCENAVISLTATDAGVGATYAWSGPSSFTSNTSIANITSAALTNGGVYNLTATLNGCSNTATQTVTVKPLPVAQITGTNTVCENAVISLTATDAGVGATYAWSGPSSFTSSTANTNISSAALTNGGIYNLTATLNGCANTATQNVSVKPLPVAQINGLTTVCESSPLNLTATNTTSGAVYNWLFSGDSVSNHTSFSITQTQLTNAGNYTLLAEKAGCSSEVNFTVVVKPLVKAIINGANGVCEKSNIELAVTDQGAGVNYIWNGPSGFTATTSSVKISHVNAANAGTYFVTMMRDGCQSTSSIDVAVKEMPKVNFSGKTELCEGDALTLSAEDAGDGAQYVWEDGKGNMYTGSKYIKTAYALDDSKNIYLTVTRNGCTNKLQIPVFAKALPAAAILGAQSFCEGDNVALDAKDAGTGAEYTWETPGNGNDKTKVLNLNKINNSQAGDYILTVQKDGCINKTVANLKVKNLPVIKFSGETNVCENSPVVITVKDQTPNTAYAWSGPVNFAAASSSIQFEKISAANSGIYTVTLTKDGCSIIDSVKLKVKALPSAIINGESSVCANSSVKLEATDAGAGAQYVWAGPSNFSAAGKVISLNDISSANEGSYQLSVIYNGCVSSNFKSITVKPVPVATYTGELSVCENASINIKATDAGTNAVYNWKDALDNTYIGNQFTKANASLQDAGIYTLTVTANNCTSVAAVDVKIKALPVAKIIGTTEVCEQSTIELKAQSEPLVSYQWKTNNVLVGSSQIMKLQSVNLNNAGVYQLTAERNGCVNTAEVTVKVKALPVIKIGGDKTVCERSDIKLAAQNEASYTWLQNGTVVSSANELIIHNASTKAAGSYSIEAVKEGCAVAEQFTVTVKTVTAKIAAKNVLCENDILTLKADDAGENAKYTWSGPSFTGTNQTEVLSSVKPAHTGNYLLTVEKDGCTNTDTVNIAVKAAPVASISGANAICENASAQLSAAVSSNASYTWQQPDGTEIKGAIVSIEKAGFKHSGQFKLTVSAEGCIATTFASLKVKPLPTAHIAGDEAVCEGLSLQFLAANAGDDAVYTWALPGDKEISGTSLKIAPIQLTNTGLYKLNVTVDGCSSSAEKYLKVTPKPEAFITGTTEVCEAALLKLEAGDAGENAVYKWIAPNGDVLTNKIISVNSISLAQKGSYTLSVTKNGCTVNTTTNVNVKKLPETSIKTSDALCEGETLTLKASSSDNVDDYEWSGPTMMNVPASSITISNVQAKHTGTYTLRARMNGCESLVTQFVKIKALPRPIIKGNNDLCEGSSLNLVGADAQTVGDFTWMTPDNKTISGQNLTISGIASSNAGLYKLKVIHDGCTSFDSLFVKVNQNPMVSLQPIADVCQFTQSSFVKANELNGLKGSGVFSGPTVSATGEIYATKVGTYNVNYIFTTDAGCSASVTGTVKVNPGISVNAGSDLTKYEDEGVQLNAMVSSTYKQLTWTNVSSGNIPNPIVKPAATTTYTVFVVNEYGCTAKDEVTVKVVRMKIPNAFSPNNDGINDKWEVEPLKNYPSCRVEIFNRAGQSVFMNKGYGVSWDGKINGQPAPEGTYYYVINVNDGKERKPLSGYVQVIR